MASLVRDIKTMVAVKQMKQMQKDLTTRQDKLNAELGNIAKHTEELGKVKLRLETAVKAGRRDRTTEKIFMIRWEANEKRRFQLEAERDMLNNIIDKTVARQKVVEERKLTDKWKKIDEKLNGGLLSDSAIGEQEDTMDLTQEVDGVVEEHNQNMQQLFAPTEAAKERDIQRLSTPAVSYFDELETMNLEEHMVPSPAVLSTQQQLERQNNQQRELETHIMNLKKQKKKNKKSE
jgi:hypothetical protein